MSPRICVKRRALWLLPCLTILSPVHAQGLTVIAGLKSWTTTWTTWGLAQSQYSDASYETVTPLNSDTQTSLIPQLSLRYGPWLVSSSYMTSTGYHLSAAFPARYFEDLHETRREIDGNVGYYVLPGIALTAGYKKLEQDAGGLITWQGPTLGLTGTVPLAIGGLSVYGTFGYGLFKLHTPGLPDSEGRTSFNATYQLAELGLAWSFLERFTVTLGYRTQTARANGYSLTEITYSNTPVPQTYSTTLLRDLTQGVTVGLAAAF